MQSKTLIGVTSLLVLLGLGLALRQQQTPDQEDHPEALERHSVAPNDDPPFPNDRVPWYLQRNVGVARTGVETTITHWSRELADLMTRSGPAEAFDWIVADCPEAYRTEALRLLVAHWAQVAPADAANFASAIADGTFRGQFCKLLVPAWAAIDAEAAARWVSQLPEDLLVTNVSSLLPFVADVSFDTARKIANALPLSAKSDWVMAVAGQWAGNNLTELLSWAGSADEVTRSGIIKVALPIWANTDPVAAAQYVDTAGLPVIFDTRRRVSIAWAESDPVAAYNWVVGLTNIAERNVAVRAVLEQYARRDPESAADYVASLEPGYFQKEAAQDVLKIWTQQNPEAAADWAFKFPQGELYHAAISTVAREYMKVDLAGAGTWLQLLPHSPARDWALGEYAQTTESVDASVAVRWAELIQDPRERERRLKNALAAWLSTDAPAARSWAQENGHPHLLINRP
jgi:hypothetical protein